MSDRTLDRAMNELLSYWWSFVFFTMSYLEKAAMVGYKLVLKSMLWAGHKHEKAEFRSMGDQEKEVMAKAISNLPLKDDIKALLIGKIYK